MVYINPIDIINNNYLTWNFLSSVSAPKIGLINYGFAVTSSGVIVLYGGQTDTAICSLQKRTLTPSNDLWIFNLSNPQPTFEIVKWLSGDIGGFSKILSLGNETVCIMNVYFENQMRILDFNEMSSYEVFIENAPQRSVRTAFGIAGANDNNFIIYGGFDPTDNKISSLTPFNILFQLTFSTKNHKDKSMESEDMSTIVIGSSIGGIVCILVLLLYSTKMRQGLKAEKEKIMEKRLKDLEDAKISLENSKRAFEERINSIVNDDTFTATLALAGNAVLAVPGYREEKFNVAFRPESLIAKGGMGEVFLGKLLKENLIEEFGTDACVIKKPLKKIAEKMFLQELSIHEVFVRNKYFAQLQCFSVDPQAIVLKYYKMGSLKNLIYRGSKIQQLEHINYNFELCCFLLQKIAWVFNIMHMKGLVHCDVKPDNILLDSDSQEKIFPVITDFGIVYITNSAQIIKEMHRVNVQGATMSYASPEIIDSITNHKDYEPTFKCDVYSLSIMALELLVRKNPWNQKFSLNMVLSGKRPQIVFVHPKTSIGESIMELLKKCWSPTPSLRPSMEDIDVFFTKLQIKS